MAIVKRVSKQVFFDICYINQGIFANANTLIPTKGIPEIFEENIPHEEVKDLLEEIQKDSLSKIF